MTGPTNTSHVDTDLSFDEATALARRLDEELGRVIIGQVRVRREVRAYARTRPGPSEPESVENRPDPLLA